VGAVARVVKNFGLGRLILVDPLSYSFERATKLAVGAEDVVAGMGMELNLPDAVSGCVLAVGTSSRRLPKRRSLLPDEAAEAILSAAGPVALVFGDEKRGLSDDELSVCQAVSRIPAGEAQPSLNLAQAAAVMGYALVQAAVHRGPIDPSEPPVEPASLGELAEMRASLQELLLSVGFLNPQNPAAILAELTAPFERAGLTRREAQLWKTALKKIGRLSAPRSGP
jgi:tRNA/rRNA methyltransferase